MRLFDKAATTALLADVKHRRGTLELMRQVIARTPMVASNKARVQSLLESRFQPATKRIRVRSSTNAEDMEGLNGAGLYVSKSICLADTASSSSGKSACMTTLEESRVRKLIARLQEMNNPALAKQIEDLQEKLTDKDEMDDAIRKVYASVWNEKAFLNRDYYGIDHQNVYMGALVHASFSDESANGVVVLTQMDTGLRANIVVQSEDISVTNPELPGALPEEWVLDSTAAGSLSRSEKIRSSSLVQNDVLTSVQLSTLMKQLVIVQRSMNRVHGAAADRLDIEFAIAADGTVLIKQARPL